MSENQDGPTVEGFGEYHPEAAGYKPYNDAMAAWRNQVKSMQQGGELPQTQEPRDEPQEDAEESSSARLNLQSEEELEERERASESDSEAKDRTAGEGEPDSGDGPHEVFDPAEHNAPEVMSYLKGAGEDEAVRVLESEEAGKARKGILNLKDEILAKARENDETGSGSKDA